MKHGVIWVFAIALAALSFMLPGFSDPYQTPRLALLSAIAAVMLLQRSEYRSELELEVLAGLLCWTAAAAFSCDPSYSLVGSFLAPFDCATAVFMYAGLAIAVGRSGCEADAAAAAITVASVPLSLYACVQRVILDKDPFLAARLPGQTRVVAMQGSPVYLGAILAISVACMLALLKRERPAKRFIQAALCLALAGIWFSGTRGALIAVAAAWFTMSETRAKWLALLAVPAAFLARRGTHGSDIGRLEDYKAAWRIFKANPLFGVGAGTYTAVVRQYLTPSYIAANRSALVSSQHAHNQVLQVLAETGLVGMLGYGAIVAGCCRVALASKDRQLLLAVGAAYAVCASLNPVPLSVTALMVLLFAAASSRPAEVVGVVTPLSLALTCAVSCMLAGRVAASDYLMEHAAKHRQDLQTVHDDVELAARLNPWEIRVASAQIDARIVYEHRITRATVEIAHRALLRHLADSSAYEVYGRAVVLGAIAGIGEDPREAMMALDRAQQLAPTFTPLMIRRRALATMLGQNGKAAAIDADIARIKRMEEGNGT